MQKVRWSNNMLVGGEHFRQQERWVEDLVAWRSHIRQEWGLIRPREGAESWNTDKLVTLERTSDPTRYTIKVFGLMAISRRGIPIVVRDEAFRCPWPRGVNSFMLYLQRVEQPPSQGESGARVTMYCDGYTVVDQYAKDPADDAVPIARIHVTDKLHLDPNYIPPVATVGGHNATECFARKIQEKIRRCCEATRQSYVRLIEAPNVERNRQLLEVARLFLARTPLVLPHLNDPEQSMRSFVALLRAYLAAINDDLADLTQSSVSSQKLQGLDEVGIDSLHELCEHARSATDVVLEAVASAFGQAALGDGIAFTSVDVEAGPPHRITVYLPQALGQLCPNGSSVRVRLALQDTPGRGSVVRIDPRRPFAQIPAAQHAHLTAFEQGYQFSFRPTEDMMAVSEIRFFCPVTPRLPIHNSIKITVVSHD